MDLCVCVVVVLIKGGEKRECVRLMFFVGFFSVGDESSLPESEVLQFGKFSYPALGIASVRGEPQSTWATSQTSQSSQSQSASDRPSLGHDPKLSVAAISQPPGLGTCSYQVGAGQVLRYVVLPEATNRAGLASLLGAVQYCKGILGPCAVYLLSDVTLA